MSNMSYCRFQNTLSDMRDCAEHLHDAFGKGTNDRDEHAARRALVELCCQIVADLDESKVTPDELGGDKDPEVQVECANCGEIERRNARGICESCADEGEEPAAEPDNSSYWTTGPRAVRR